MHFRCLIVIFSGFHNRGDAESWISSSVAPTFAAGGCGSGTAASTVNIAPSSSSESSFGGTASNSAPASAAIVAAVKTPPSEHSSVKADAATLAQVQQVVDYTGKNAAVATIFIPSHLPKPYHYHHHAPGCPVDKARRALEQHSSPRSAIIHM
jgi:hypothetical protein